MFLVLMSAYAVCLPRSLQMLPTRRSPVIRSTTTVVSGKRFMTSIRETLHTLVMCAFVSYGCGLGVVNSKDC